MFVSSSSSSSSFSSSSSSSFFLSGALGQRVNYPGPVCGIKGSTVTLPCSFNTLKSVNDNGRKVLIEIIRVVWCKNHPICQGTTPSVYDSESKNNDHRYRYLGDKKGDCTLQISDLQEEDDATFRFRVETNDRRATFAGQSGVRVRVEGKSISRNSKRLGHKHMHTHTHTDTHTYAHTQTLAHIHRHTKHTSWRTTAPSQCRTACMWRLTRKVSLISFYLKTFSDQIQTQQVCL